MKKSRLSSPLPRKHQRSRRRSLNCEGPVSARVRAKQRAAMPQRRTMEEALEAPRSSSSLRNSPMKPQRQPAASTAAVQRPRIRTALPARR